MLPIFSELSCIPPEIIRKPRFYAYFRGKRTLLIYINLLNIRSEVWRPSLSESLNPVHSGSGRREYSFFYVVELPHDPGYLERQSPRGVL